jgi:putative transposase
MIDRKNELSVKRQCKLLELARSTFYYKPAEVSEADLELMKRIDELHTEFVYAGSRKICSLLKREGYAVGRRHVSTLMRKMGIEALYRKPNTSRRGKRAQIYPYLLRKLEITRANQVWAADITYIPMRLGFAYLFAVMDWYSRRVLTFRLSNSMMSDFCVEAVKEAFESYGKPEIFNTDQGSQFTSEEFTGLLKQADVRISMDGKGSWRDNVFVERLWRSVKYEEVYLYAYESMTEARKGLKDYFECYNTRRPHQSLDYRTPDEVYFEVSEKRAA